MPINATISAASASGFRTSLQKAPALYLFTSATFTPGTASGLQGPNLTQARAAVGNPSWSTTYMAMPYPGYIEWTVPDTAVYTFTLAGAQGGGGERYASANNPASDFASTAWLRGGKGSIIQFNYSLTAGEKLGIVVGQYGGSGYEQSFSRAGGGGGGTWLYSIPSETLIACAGGGGGASDSYEGQDGTGASAGNASAGNGQGGTSTSAGSGGGWFSNGASVAATNICSGSYSCRGGAVKPSVGSYGVAHSGYTNSSMACHFERFGGFGGGGSQHDNTAGGGGGYTGGGSQGSGTAGFPGTSYITPSATSVSLNVGLNGGTTQSVQNSHGYLQVTKN